MLASRDSLSPDCIPSRTFGKSCLHLAPSVLRLGKTSIFWNLSKSSSNEIVSTFNSSARISWKSDKSGPLTIHPSAQGNLCLLSDSTLIFLPVSANSLTSSMVCISSLSISPISGQSAKWTESPVRFLWIESDINGDTGAISLQIVTSTSCRVCWQASLSLLSASSQSLLLDLLTYQFDTSFTTNSSMSLHALWKSQFSNCSDVDCVTWAKRESIHLSSGVLLPALDDSGSNPSSEA